MIRFWRLGGLLGLLGVGLMGAGLGLGISAGNRWLDEQTAAADYLQAIVSQPGLWTAYALLVGLAAPLLLIVANGALFDYLGMTTQSRLARPGIWLGTAGFVLVLATGALYYVVYPRLASAFRADPAAAAGIFLPLHLLDFALVHFGWLVGFGVAGLVAGVIGWQASGWRRLAALPAGLAFAAQVANLLFNFQQVQASQIALGVGLGWTLVYSLLLLSARRPKDAPAPPPPITQPAARPARYTPPESTTQPAPAEDPYAPAPPAPAPRLDVDPAGADAAHTRFQPPKAPDSAEKRPEN